jgi:hypothetical protein
MKRLLVKPDDLQALGKVPDLVGIAKLRRQVASRAIRREPEVHNLASSQEERLTIRR